MKRYSRFLILALLAVTVSAKAIEQKSPYLPIVLVHGILSDDYGMAPTEHYIRKHMGENVYIKNVQLGFGEITTLTNLHHQAEYLRKAIQKDPKLTGGFNMITHSQGGLVGRYYVERYNAPQVYTYISWGSPQQGVFGMPSTIDNYFKWLDYMESQMHRILYSAAFQKFVGFAGYWHDTLHYDKYLRKSRFLPYINNEIDHAHAALFKQNITSLKNMVLVMSLNDDIIEPRISCHFGFYKQGSKTEIEEMQDSAIYDRLGLKDLNESGRLHLRLASCSHAQFQEDESNFVENTLEFLKADPFATTEAPTTQVTAAEHPTEEAITATV